MPCTAENSGHTADDWLFGCMTDRAIFYTLYCPETTAQNAFKCSLVQLTRLLSIFVSEKISNKACIDIGLSPGAASTIWPITAKVTSSLKPEVHNIS